MNDLSKAERAYKVAAARGLAAARDYDAAILAAWDTPQGSSERIAAYQRALSLDAANERISIARLNVCLAERA